MRRLYRVNDCIIQDLRPHVRQIKIKDITFLRGFQQGLIALCEHRWLRFYTSPSVGASRGATVGLALNRSSHY